MKAEHKPWSSEEIAKVIEKCFHQDWGVESANIVDALFDISRAIDNLAKAIREK